MNYSTLDRFQGAWLGSMIGSALSNNLYKSDYNKVLNYKFQHWVDIRNEIAEVAISSSSKSMLQTAEVSSTGTITKCCLAARQSRIIFEEAIQNLLENHFNNFLRYFSDIPNNFEQIPKANLISYYCRSISALLPLIILQQDNNRVCNLYIKTIAKYVSNLALVESIQQDIATWNCIVTMALNNQFLFEESNVSLTSERILNGIEAKSSSLVEKLNIVNQAWENGWSLKHLTTKLYRHESLTKETILTPGLAIALSFYCFACTPRNFMLSVKRATKIDCNLSMPIALLTATISGAYNGRTSIPKNWLKAAGNCQPYQLAQKTVKRLYQNWLGVYDLDNLELLCNLDGSKIATPKIFQIRRNLNIVSQNYNSD